MHQIADHVVIAAGDFFYSQPLDLAGDNFVQMEAWLISANGTATGAGGLELSLESSNDLSAWTAIGFPTLQFGSGTEAPDYKLEPAGSAVATYAKYVRLKAENKEASIKFMFSARLSTYELSS